MKHGEQDAMRMKLVNAPFETKNDGNAAARRIRTASNSRGVLGVSNQNGRLLLRSGEMADYTTSNHQLHSPLRSTRAEKRLEFAIIDQQQSLDQLLVRGKGLSLRRVGHDAVSWQDGHGTLIV